MAGRRRNPDGTTRSGRTGNGSWPPFKPGNEKGLKHGANSPRRVAPIAARLRTELADAAPWTNVPTFASVVAAWAQAEAQCVLLRSYFDEVGLLDDEGNPRPGMIQLDRCESRAAALRRELGLTPAAWAKLVQRLGTTDGEAAARGIEALQAIGAAIGERLRALPSKLSDEDGTEDRSDVVDLREGHGDGTEGKRDEVAS